MFYNVSCSKRLMKDRAVPTVVAARCAPHPRAAQRGPPCSGVVVTPLLALPARLYPYTYHHICGHKSSAGARLTAAVSAYIRRCVTETYTSRSDRRGTATHTVRCSRCNRTSALQLATNPYARTTPRHPSNARRQSKQRQPGTASRKRVTTERASNVIESQSRSARYV